MSKRIFIKFCIICPLCGLFNFSFSQKEETINEQPGIHDTILLGEYSQLLTDFIETYKDSAFYYGYKALALAKRLNQKYYEGFILCDLAYNSISVGDYTNALKYLIDATKLSEDEELSTNIVKTPFIEPYLQKDTETNRRELLGWIKNSLGILYGYTESADKKLNELLEAKYLVENKVTDMFLLAGICSNIVDVYLTKNKLDSALYYQRETMKYENSASRQTYNGVSLAVIGEIFLRQGKSDSAKEYLFKGIKILKTQDEDLIGLGQSYVSLANLYYNANLPDSGIYYANNALRSFHLAGNEIPETLDAYTTLALNYSKIKRDDSAYKYMVLAKKLSDSLNEIQLSNLGKFHSIGFEEKLRLKDLENETIVTKNRNRIILLSIVIVVFLIIAFILYRNNKIKQKTNKILQTTLSNLKATQKQLIQSEKMASLGELTAGIAHEIQNPLNFVNNFSEVNNELIEEMNNESDISEIKTLANDIKQNNEKIAFHGKRADAIVKGMLQHSRASSGKKEPTDINALADEYLRLSYHGMRAKDKNFNATLQTDFDATIGKINIVPQDIGRVLLNLFNNAFYAVNEKRKNREGLETYKPTVLVKTKKINDKIEIKVSDNGIGIPQKIVDKIFQPFFTTKPTGQGTGLGLSLSYDIIKAHGGEIKVETKNGEGSDFIIELPYSLR